MKFFGSVEPLGSSSARKYLSTCVSCFQKFKVSCCISISSACSCPSGPFVSCPVHIPANVLQFFPPFIFRPLLCPLLLFPPLLLPPLLFPPLLFLPLLSPQPPISIPPSPSLSPSPSPPLPLPQKHKKRKTTHLKLLMTIKQQNIHRLQLIHISMPLKFLSNFGSNFRHGHIERIHGLDFRCLLYPHTHIAMISTLFSMSISLSISSLFLFLLFLPSSQHHIVSKSKKKKNQTYRSQPIPITRQNSLFRITPCRGCWLPKSNSLVSFRSRIHHHHLIIPPLECGRVG